MQQKIQIMLEMQNNMNSKVHSQWREQNFDWYRAIWIESAEMLDHYGWKWWKKQTPDIEQVTLELVDIWHFGLSILLLEDQVANGISDTTEKALNSQQDVATFPLELEKFVANTLATKSFDLEGFVRLMKTIELSFDELYVQYVGKNVLNFFRQDNGYKDGSYRKVWAGREDNEHLVELAASLDSTSVTFKDELYQALNDRYGESA